MGIDDAKLKEITDEFIKRTGFNIRNCTEAEWNEHWLDRKKKEAESDKYIAKLLDSVMHIIDNKEYSHLFAIMKNYDELVKADIDRAMEEYGVESDFKYKNFGLPYWCCCLGYAGTQNSAEGGKGQ